MEENYWKEPRFCFYTKKGTLKNNYGDTLFPILASSSNNHFIVLTDTNELYTYGETLDDQTDNIINEDNTLRKVELPNKSKILEIACGNSFSILLHESNSITILTEDSSEIMENFIAPRGLASNLEQFSFIANRSDVYLFESDRTHKTSTIDGEQMITTALTEHKIFILSVTGKIFCSNTDALDFKQVEIPFTAHSVFNLTNGILCISQDNRAFLIDNDLKIHCIVTPYGVEIVHAAFFNKLICLDASGRILTANLSDERPVLLLSSQLSQHHVSCITASHILLTLFMGGSPRPSFSVPSQDKMFLNYINATIDGHKLLMVSEAYAFFSNRRVTMREFTKIIKSNAPIEYDDDSLRIYYTDDSRLIGVNVDRTLAFSFNFLPGDIVETPEGQRGTLIGVEGGRVWVEPFKDTRLVYCASNPRNLKIIKREGHELRNLIVDGISASVDLTPSFVEQFSVSLGDLFNIPNHGICQLIGAYCGKLTFRDFSNDHFFATRPLTYERVRTESDKFPPVRNVMTPDGLVEVSILSKRRILKPCDRVETPIGPGTVIGFAGNFVYVQTDEMRLAQIGAAKFNPLDLKIIRRIGLPAKRKFYDKEGNEKVLSVSSIDRVRNLMAGDRILQHGMRGTVAGVDNGALYVIMDNTNYVTKVDDGELLYRADILGGPCCETYEVGSPALGMSTLLPDDVVEFNDDVQYIFKGIARSGPLFVRCDTFEMFSTSFSALLTPSSYKLVERRSKPKPVNK